MRTILPLDVRVWPLVSVTLLVCGLCCRAVPVFTTVVTSMARLQNLVDVHEDLVQRLGQLILEERDLLANLARSEKGFKSEETKSRQAQLAKMKKLHTGLLRTADEVGVARRKKTAEHPNGAFLLLQDFLHTWGQLNASAMPQALRQRWGLDRLLPRVGLEDYTDACMALLALHRVYGFRPKDMASGYYLHYRGPKLSPMDAYDVGSVGVASGQTDRGLQWLQLAVTSANVTQTPRFPMVEALARMTRAHTALNNTAEVTSLLSYARQLRVAPEAMQKLKALVTSRNSSRRHVYNETLRENEDALLVNYSRLCRRRHTTRVLQRHHYCRYRCWQCPLLRYKEMILHDRPYISVFYDVITDADEQEIASLAFKELMSLTVPVNPVNPNRTSQSVFLEEELSPVLRRLTRLTEAMTGLSTASPWPAAPNSAEPFVAVNYGIGGRFESHYDFFENLPSNPRACLKDSGNRIATFLIYVTDVTYGGNTVFPRIDLAVPPVKHGALFWYNFSPDHQPDPLTLHAGCPVVIGQKWVINKWIREYGNTFRRPCPLLQSDSQMALDSQLRPPC